MSWLFWVYIKNKARDCEPCPIKYDELIISPPLCLRCHLERG